MKNRSNKSKKRNRSGSDSAERERSQFTSASVLTVPPHVKEALRVGRTVRLRAHAPYSRFLVGAGLVSEKRVFFGGCNVENASYGGTVCAERVAIFQAVAAGETRFSDIVVVTDAEKPAFPCAFCLQVMAEFFQPDTKIWIANLKGIQSVHEFRELLPKPFGPAQLGAAKKTRGGSGRPRRAMD